MKKLNKLQINAERLMKNEDLLKIKGGEYENACTCSCYDSTFFFKPYGYYVAPDGNCGAGCAEAFGFPITGHCAGK